MDRAVKAVDGRTARADNTRRRIVSSMIALIEEGHLRPTAAAIADRAEVSVRSVFQHFNDLGALFQAAADSTMHRVWSLVRPIPDSGTLDERLDALLAMRWDIYDHIAAIRRAASLIEDQLPMFVEGRNQFRHMLRGVIDRIFAGELVHLDADARRQSLDAMIVVCEFEFMEVLRRQMELPREQAMAAQRRAMMSLLKQKEC
jgi:TetR/AcrR family transcriptional regulator of autoinduction and epiphytic fitness